MRDSRGVIYSSAFHGLILVLLIFGLPDFFHRPIETEPEAISVDILPISQVSNVKPQEKTPEKQDKKPIADKTTDRKAVQETHKEETKPEEKPEIISAKEIKKPDKKKPEKKKPEEKKKEKQDDFSKILQSVENTAKSEESKKPTQQRVVPNQHEAKSQNYDASQPLSMSEMDAIRSQIEQCWNPNVGAKNTESLTVSLHIVMNQDGSVASVELARDQGRYASDSYFAAAADAALRAVKRCSPYKNLPADKYGTWRDMITDFTPPMT